MNDIKLASIYLMVSGLTIVLFEVLANAQPGLFFKPVFGSPPHYMLMFYLFTLLAIVGGVVCLRAENGFVFFFLAIVATYLLHEEGMLILRELAPSTDLGPGGVIFLYAFQISVLLLSVTGLLSIIIRKLYRWIQIRFKMNCKS